MFYFKIKKKHSGVYLLNKNNDTLQYVDIVHLRTRALVYALIRNDINKHSNRRIRNGAKQMFLTTFIYSIYSMTNVNNFVLELFLRVFFTTYKLEA